MIKTVSTFFLAALIPASVHLAYAQKQATTPRIGILSLGAPPNANLDVFIQRLRELGPPICRSSSRRNLNLYLI